MAHLQLKLLGTPEVYHAGQLLVFPTRKALALLIYLAVEGGSHSREKAMALFWPESDSAHGRAALRRTLVHVRHTLQHGIISGEPEMPHLLIEHDSLSFNFNSDFELDLRTVEAAYAQVHVPGRPQASPLHEIDELQAAVSLYRSGFLEGFSLSDAPDFDGWTGIQREVWYRRLDLVFDRLAHMQFEAGALTNAIETVTRWLTLNPLNEKTYRLLIRLHFAFGNREAALQAYEACRAILARELHMKPAPQTQALAEQVRTRPPPCSKIPRQVAESMRLETPFVGREAEFTQLVRVFHTASHGRPQVVIVEGEAGIGKTRLVSEFLAWTASHGADVLQGRAFEAGGRLPYHPLVEALRSCLERVNAPDDLLSDTWLAELSRLLPEIRDRYPDLPFPPTEEGAAKTRLFETIVRLFQALSERAPLVFFLDDIQWADSATLDVLSYAIRRWRESKTHLLFLLNLRAEGLTPMLIDWVTNLAHDLALTRLPLIPLAPEHMLRMIYGLVQKQPGDDERLRLAVERFGRWLFTETGGQPFFVVETLNALLDRGIVLRRGPSVDGVDGGIDIAHAVRDEDRLRSFLPEGVREVISLRLARLTQTALELLAAGAVLGQRITFERLSKVTGLSESDALSALDGVLRSHLLYEAESPDGVVYMFAHDKIRDVVYAGAGDARRRIFHRRALEVLSSEREAAKKRPAVASHAELAHHALASGQREAAFRLNVNAGDEAMELFAVRDAVMFYEQAWRLVEGLGEREALVDVSSADRDHLYIRLGRAFELTNDFEKARRMYRAMLDYARRAGLSTMEGTALNRLATLAVLENFDLIEAESFLQQTLPIAEQSEDTLLLAETEWSLAQVGYYSSNGRMSLAHGQRALKLARKLDRQELIARSLNVLAYANELLGRWEEAEASALHARILYRVLKDRAMEVDCLGQIAKVRICDGRAQAGMSVAQEALVISAEIENAWGQAYSTFHLAMGSLELGMYADALSFAQQCLALARAHNLTMFMSISLTMMGRAHRAMLELNAAHMVLQEALALNEVQKTPWLEMISEELCAVSVLAGRWADAYTYALQAMNSRHNALYLYVGLTHWYRTGALLHTNDIEHALEDIRLFGEKISGSRRHRIPYLRSLAVLAQNHGEIDMALEHLQEAATLTEEIGLPGERWSIEVALGDLYLAQANEHLACQAYARAAEIVRSLAEKIENEDQRTAFLSAQAVQQILQRAEQN